MSARIFVDTNVIVYRFDTTEPEKHERAERWLDALWANRAGRLSTQVVHDLYVTLTRKLSMAREDSRAIVRSLHAWEPVRLDQDLVEDAWLLEDRFELSFWDALIVAAARSSGSTHLLTEDLQHEQDFDGVEVVNPFAATPEMVFKGAAG